MNETTGNIRQAAEASGLRHIAFIMDGNRRWARANGKRETEGHRVGAEVFRAVTRYCCGTLGIGTVTVYAFSTENWKRSTEEVGAIMRLFGQYLDDVLDKLFSDDIQIHFLGEKEGLSADLIRRMERAEAKTADRTYSLNIALNYGGRGEIVHAVNALLAEGKTSVTEEDITARLYNPAAPMPDLIVRCGGEIRTSNFLTWESIYSEWFFCDTLWPNFSEEDVNRAVLEFSRRQRRFGGV